MGGSQYHPMLKFLGLMPAKNAVINLIILSTFFSFLLYRRGNKSDVVSIREQGKGARITIIRWGLAAHCVVGQYAVTMLTMDPGRSTCRPTGRKYIRTDRLRAGV